MATPNRFSSRAGSLAGVGLAALLVLTGCGDGTSDETLAREQAIVHSVARDVADLSGVACAMGGLDDQGAMTTPRGSIFFEVTPEPGLPEQAQRGLIRDTAERLWRSDLAALTTLRLITPGGDVTVGEVLGAQSSFVTHAELEAAFGLRPTPPPATTPVSDPGNPTC